MVDVLKKSELKGLWNFLKILFYFWSSVLQYFRLQPNNTDFINYLKQKIDENKILSSALEAKVGVKIFSERPYQKRELDVVVHGQLIQCYSKVTERATTN